MTESTNPTCPKCGAPIPENAPQSLCPKCVLENAATIPDSTESPTRPTPPATIEELAEHFPYLEIVELIGAGGMGAVYKARQPKLDRFVALKILTKDLAEDPAFVERFNREARVLARLNHPNIVTVFDFGTAGPFCFLVMEFIDGVNLRQAMHAGGFTPPEALGLVQDICGALGFAHEEGILHRDIKPENILIDSRGRVKIADFGIAKLVGEEREADFTLTMQGSILGSPQYMAPEQIESPGDIDQRADIYSLGVVFYELLTGELPLGRFAAPSEKSSMDPRIDEIVMRTLEKERQLRYQSTDEIRNKVETISQSAPAGHGEPSGTSGPAGSAAVAATAPAPAPIDPEAPAKFATASAILTGLGIVMCAAFFVSMPLFARDIHNDPDERRAFAIYTLVGGLVVGATLLLGIILGAKALAEIRRSDGRRAGLGSAIFGTLAVPVLVVLGLSVPSISALFMTLASGGGNIIPILIAIAAGTAGILSVTMLIRTVGRWAQGTSDPDGGATGSQLATRVGFLFLAGVLNVIVLMLYFMPLEQQGKNPGPRISGDGRDQVIPKVEPRPNVQPRQELWDRHWQPDGPDKILHFKLPEGQAATVELVRTDKSGKETIDHRWAAIASDSKPFEGILSIGAPADLQARQQEGVAALKATFWSYRGTGPDSVLSKFYTGELSFNIGQRYLDLGRPDRDKSRDTLSLGSFRADETSPAQFLSLRVSSEPRPGSGGPIVLEDELIGKDRPAELWDEWLKRQSAEAELATDPEGEADNPEIELNFVAPAGRVTVFSLQAPWDRRHRSPDGFYVVASDEEDFEGTIKIAVTKNVVVDGKPKREVLAMIHGTDGKPVAEHRLMIAGDHTVSLPPKYPILKIESGEPDGEITGHGLSDSSDTLDLSVRGLHFVVFGHHSNSLLDDSLRLLAWSVARPDAGSKLGEGRIGAATPPDTIDGWIKQKQKRLAETKWSPTPPDYTLFSVEKVEGAVRVRSGFRFDTREHPVTAPTELRQSESLFLKKGSQATLSRGQQVIAQLGPQTEDGLLVFNHEQSWLVTPLGGLRAQFDQKPQGGDILIDTVFSATLKISEPVTFLLSSRGKLQIFEGRLEIDGYPEGSSTTVIEGQELSLPQPPMLEDNDPSNKNAP